MNIIYTVCNRINLAHALALADSVLLHQPNHTFYLAWVDNVPVQVPPHVKLLTIEQAEIPAWESMNAKYYHFELLAACRPWFALALLRLHSECKNLIFLAPTVLLVKPFGEVLNDSSEIHLTPNIRKPLAPSKLLDDKRILNIGMFHSGSWMLKVGEQTTKLLRWWAERTIDRAEFDLCNGKNMDQLWLNYTLVWIPETTQIAHPGWHYGLHSILNHELQNKNGDYYIEGEPLISLDFAGLDYFDPVWSNHIGLMSSNRAFHVLFDNYKKTLTKYKHSLPADRMPGFGKPAKIRENRILRNNIAAKLKSITAFIDQF
ncbi:hypothetical protein [Dyadobacter chenhuakuii]|uniref:Uncharacterized protein n=1 Tax=Dyadobacter chenhuakuii TaxID=2909339 RepID=A0ABY4XK47_9BACT|nr:hypothetical protein [Dyadobacter chenhuakuii]MCF2493689.1 hypothetical protein [Dyadobacter chenhuakuii]USJ30824.1 hypothetical protein NFI80_23570 [Dyadobacter chenhuakuii]